MTRLVQLCIILAAFSENEMKKPFVVFAMIMSALAGYYAGVAEPTVVSGPCRERALIADKSNCVTVDNKMVCMRNED